MRVSLSANSFDPWQEAQRLEKQVIDRQLGFGATASFIGTMRDFNENCQVTKMTLEYYPGMTEKQLDQIVAEVFQRWSILDARVVHRVGEISPGEAIVLVLVWSTHRGAAIDACRHIIEALKHRAPFWKKEALVNQEERWVAKNTTGYFDNADQSE